MKWYLSLIPIGNFRTRVFSTKRQIQWARWSGLANKDDWILRKGIGGWRLRCFFSWWDGTLHHPWVSSHHVWHADLVFFRSRLKTNVQIIFRWYAIHLGRSVYRQRKPIPERWQVRVVATRIYRGSRSYHLSVVRTWRGGFWLHTANPRVEWWRRFQYRWDKGRVGLTSPGVTWFISNKGRG